MYATLTPSFNPVASSHDVVRKTVSVRYCKMTKVLAPNYVSSVSRDGAAILISILVYESTEYLCGHTLTANQFDTELFIVN